MPGIEEASERAAAAAAESYQLSGGIESCKEGERDRARGGRENGEREREREKNALSKLAVVERAWLVRQQQSALDTVLLLSWQSTALLTHRLCMYVIVLSRCVCGT